MAEKVKRGFALLSPERRAELSRMGAKKAHETGRAHKWTPEEARVAGSLGGQATARKLKGNTSTTHDFDTGQLIYPSKDGAA